MHIVDAATTGILLPHKSFQMCPCVAYPYHKSNIHQNILFKIQ